MSDEHDNPTRPPGGPPPDADQAPPGAATRRRRGQLAEDTVLNNMWRVGALIARGGMGEVYVGEHVNTGDKVAIKVLLQHLANNPNTQRLLLAEARKMNRIRHDAVVHYITMAEDPDRDVTYLVMDFIDGVGLGTVIGVLHPTQLELIGLMRRLAEGLAAAHKAGVYHRDLS